MDPSLDRAETPLQGSVHTPAPAVPRFSRLLTTVLGSPFLATDDLPRDDPHPTFTPAADMHTDDLEAVDGVLASVPRAHTVTRPTSPTPSFSTDTYSFLDWSPAAALDTPPHRPSFSDAAPHCSLLPGPAKRSALPYASYNSLAPHPHTAPTPSSTMRFPASLSHPAQLKHARSSGLLPRLWDALRDSSPVKKGKRRSDDAPSCTDPDDPYIDFANLPPLDGEEGELIDDEACFIDVRAVTGIDIIAQIPDELALYLFTFLDLQDVLACTLVSRTWNRSASDNSVWRALFARRRVDGWDVDLRRLRRTAPTAAARFASAHSANPNKRRRTLPAPLELDWHALYRTRAELDRRWSGAAVPVSPAPGGEEDKENVRVKAWEPEVRRLQGHHDSVYCAEFDSARIITGSRDRSIKVWSLKTGRCLATVTGHRGSVLCLKFAKDWDLDPRNALEGAGEELAGWRRGFMVSGSSDCTVCVWDLYACTVDGGEGGEEGGEVETAVTAELRGMLRGHAGGVLDIEISDEWIVSCSKDALIRVWNRATLEVHRTFDGHEGPVNAIGLQGSRVVSASGDGKMMLWDIASGARLRTFEGHDRGLACIEFKDDLIVSGSNDRKIKVWRASTGECVRTLSGHAHLVRALACDARAGRLVSGSYDRTVKVWDLRTGRVVREFRGQYASHIFDVRVDCARVVSTSHDHSIVVFDFGRGLDTSLLV